VNCGGVLSLDEYLRAVKINQELMGNQAAP